MTSEQLCPKCGTLLPDDVPAGHCPKCLMELGFESHGGDGASASAAEPVASGALQWSREFLESLFPELDLTHQLGQGGMGVVWKAQQKNLDRPVALKLLNRSLASDPAFAERFLREARAMGRLNHSAIINVTVLQDWMMRQHPDAENKTIADDVLVIAAVVRGVAMDQTLGFTRDRSILELIPRNNERMHRFPPGHRPRFDRDPPFIPAFLAVALSAVVWLVGLVRAVKGGLRSPDAQNNQILRRSKLIAVTGLIALLWSSTCYLLRPVVRIAVK